VKRIISAVVLILFIPICFAADKDDKPKPAQSIDALRQQLETILKDTHTPGVSVAIVHKDGPEWVTGLGVSDVAANRPAKADTLFRIGSTSKAFTSLSILMLSDQGKLSLDDPVHKLAPDLWFENRWESTDPIRVVHLLEHTTGWDDMHLREYAKDAPPSMTTLEGRMTGLEVRITALETRFTALETRVTALENKVAALAGEVAALAGKISVLTWAVGINAAATIAILGVLLRGH